MNEGRKRNEKERLETSDRGLSKIYVESTVKESLRWNLVGS